MRCLAGDQAVQSGQVALTIGRSQSELLDQPRELFWDVISRHLVKAPMHRFGQCSGKVRPKLRPGQLPQSKSWIAPGRRGQPTLFQQTKDYQKIITSDPLDRCYSGTAV